MDRYKETADTEQPERNTIIVEDDVLREGFTQVPNILLRMPELTHGAKLAYALLLSYAWGERRCFPGQAVLAHDMGVERKAVIRYLKELKDRGVIRVERRGMGKTNVYILPRLSDVPFLGHQEVPSPGQQDVPPVGHNEYSLKNTQKEEYSSNLRKAEPSKDDGEDDQPPRPHPARSTGFEPVGTTLNRRRRSPTYDEDRQRILAYLEDFARELGDQAPLKSSVTRAYKLYKASGWPIERFTDALYQARAITKERSASIRTQSGDPAFGRSPKNRAAYFFAVLEDVLGLKANDHTPGQPLSPP